MNDKPLIQIDNEIREMTEEEFAEWERVKNSLPPNPFFQSEE